jgi:protein gp37
MSDGTKIEWTDATWNPITGCSVVSPGCTNCYAMRLAGTRLKHHPSRAGLTKDTKAGPVWNGEIRFNEGMLDHPLRWSRPRMIFVCAHGDLFAEGVTDEMLDRVFAVMALAPQHTFQVLTKRPERMRAYCAAITSDDRRLELSNIVDALCGADFYRAHKGDWFAGCKGDQPLPNVWLGVSVEDQRRADERIPILLDTPAAVRWISAEPLLGPVDLHPYLLGFPAGHPASCACGHGHGFDRCPNYGRVAQRCHKCGCTEFRKALGADGLHWVVAGGESGRGARPMHPDWARSLRDQCAAAGVPFLFKQWGAWVTEDQSPEDIVLPGQSRGAWATKDSDGEWGGDQTQVYSVGKKAAGRLLDGVEHNGFPEAHHAV